MDKITEVERLYLEHKDHIYNFLARMADDPELAMDVTQQTFVKALGDKNFSQVLNPKAYLFTIARNTLFNEFKKKKPVSLDAAEESGDYEAEDKDEDLHKAAEIVDIQAKVEKSIKRMPAKSRELMILRYTEDLSIKEIASITGRSLSDVKVNLHRSKIKFESSFTSEMYAKVAISRDRCDVLTELLEPHINVEISEQSLLSIDKHITTCKICSEDADELKRSRTLFNFAALLSAPYILDQMMGEAMASELKFLSSPDNAAQSSSVSNAAEQTNNQVTENTTGNTTGKPSAISNITEKALTYKLVSTIIVVIVIVISGVVLNKIFSDDTALVVSPINVPATLPKVKLTAGVTTTVNFKAVNSRSGKTINQGLKWDIYNIADASGQSVSGTDNLIKSSSEAGFNMTLDSAYYLTKVTYKGITLKSEFAVRSDEPVNITLNFDTDSVTKNQPDSSLPSIHIRRLETGTQESSLLKIQWDMCVSMINTYKESRDKYPDMWVMQERDLKEQNPEFNLDRAISAEPDWSTLKENYEDEYFSGEKYAIYRSGNYYELSEDGSCDLNKTAYKTATIDDGEFTYSIDFVEKMAEKGMSERVIEKNTQAMYKELADENPLLSKMMGGMIAEAMIGKPGSEQEEKSLQAIKQLDNLTKTAGSEKFAGETCEYNKMGEQMGVRICYWKTMPQYPSTVKRDIVLATTVELGGNSESLFSGKTTSKAILFEKNIKLNDSIFSVPSDIEIDSRNYDLMQQEFAVPGDD